MTVGAYNTLACDLPGDVMLEILSRIPVKFLLKFNCVNQSWYSLLKNPYFIKKHFRQSKTEDVRFMVLGQDIESNIGVIFPGSSKWELIETRSPDSLEYIGGSNGLICMTPMNTSQHCSKFLVINPTLKECVTISKNLVSSNKPEIYDFIPLGFGFDHKHGDFKIVRVERLKDRSWDRCSEINIYSLYTNTWKKIECSLNISFGSQYGVQCGNFMCWKSKSSEDLTVLNLSTERFYTIPSPGQCVKLQSRYNLLYAAVCLCDSKHVIDETITWKYSVLPSKDPDICEFSWKKEKVILMEDVKYYIQNEEELERKALAFTEYKRVIVVPFTESLVPVKGFADFLNSENVKNTTF